jgi:Helix-turn-helix domain of resolvase
MSKKKPAPKTAPKAKRKASKSKAATPLEVVEAVIGTTAKATGKRAGRPSKYDPAMRTTIIELGRKGKSKTQCAAHLNIARSTFDAWLGQHEEFKDAWDLADTHAQAFWEEIGFGGVGNKFFNDRAWSLQVRNRFPRDYKESRELELSGVGGAPIQIVMSPADARL